MYINREIHFNKAIEFQLKLSLFLFQFLWPLQAFRSSKGHQILHHKHLKYAIDPGERGAEQEDDPHAVRHVEKSITDSLDFEFYVGPWSACSQTCGINDSGYRVSYGDHINNFL